MKKVIILILSILLLSGCDYKELNNLGIITMITLDYKDNSYIANVELLNINKDSNKKSIIIKGNGKTLDKALNNAESDSEYIFNYSHLYTIIISDSLATKKQREIDDYLIRNKDLRKDFLIFYSSDIHNILKYKTNMSNSIGESIFNIVNNSKSTFLTSKYREIIHSRLNKSSYLIGNIENKNNTFKFNNYYLFTNNKKVIIDKEYAFLYGLLNNKVKTFNINYNDNSFKVYGYNIKTKCKNNDIKIIVKPRIKILGLNNQDIDTYKNINKLEKRLNKQIESRINKIINYSYKENIDINNLENIYYLKYKKHINFQNIKVNTIVKSTINEKGLSKEGIN